MQSWRRLRSGLALLGAALLGSAITPSAARAGGEHDWVGVAKCGTCHKKELIGNQVAVWRKGPHARAWATLASEASQRIASELALATPAQQAPECLRCHASAHGVSEERRAYALDEAEGVQCESCHGPGRDYRKKTIMSEREKAEARGLWNPGENVGICTTCHNRESPTFDEKRFQRRDGSHSGFDYELALERIVHPIPADVKGHYVELEKQQKEAERKQRQGG